VDTLVYANSSGPLSDLKCRLRTNVRYSVLPGFETLFLCENDSRTNRLTARLVFFESREVRCTLLTR